MPDVETKGGNEKFTDSVEPIINSWKQRGTTTHFAVELELRHPIRFRRLGPDD